MDAPALTVYSPQTVYILGDRFFLPAPKPPAAPNQPETIGGLLNLALRDQDNTAQYALVQIDVDSLALKSLNAAAGQSLARQDLSGIDNGADSAGTPALRTTGISLARNEHARFINDRITQAAGNDEKMRQDQLATQEQASVTLFAEDLTRGIRFNVRNDATGTWHSLHARTGTITFGGTPGTALVDQVADEGLAQPAAGQLAPGNNMPPEAQDQLYVHESVMHWQGWSLNTPRPGKTLANSGPQSIKSQGDTAGFQLEAAFSPTAQSLPRLRFGRKYQIRGRVVDLAGNSLSLADADAVLQFLAVLQRPAPVLPGNLDEFTYRRFEAVSAPVLVPREKFSEGESLECLVIRSNGQEAAADCAARLTKLVTAAHPDAPLIYTGANERHVVPPKRHCGWWKRWACLTRRSVHVQMKRSRNSDKGLTAFTVSPAKRKAGSRTHLSLTAARVRPYRFRRGMSRLFLPANLHRALLIKKVIHIKTHLRGMPSTMNNNSACPTCRIHWHAVLR